MIKRAIVLILSLCLLICSAISVSAAGSGSIIFKENFSASNALDKFTVETGTGELMQEEENQFVRFYTGKDGYTRILMEPQAKNFDFSFKLRVAAVNNTTGMVCAMFKSPSFPTDPYITYRLDFNNIETKVAAYDLYADNKTALTLYSDSNTLIKTGLWFNVKICSREKQIFVYVNGELSIMTEDSTYDTSGGFGFFGRHYNFDIDDIELTKYTGKNLPNPTPNEKPLWTGDPEDEEKEQVMDTGSEGYNFLRGGEEGSETIADPNKLTINSYIAIGLIAGLIIMAASTLTVTLLLLKSKKRESAKEADQDEKIS